MHVRWSQYMGHVVPGSCSTHSRSGAWGRTAPGSRPLMWTVRNHFYHFAACPSPIPVLPPCANEWWGSPLESMSPDMRPVRHDMYIGGLGGQRPPALPNAGNCFALLACTHARTQLNSRVTHHFKSPGCLSPLPRFLFVFVMFVSFWCCFFLYVGCIENSPQHGLEVDLLAFYVSKIVQNVLLLITNIVQSISFVLLRQPHPNRDPIVYLKHLNFISRCSNNSTSSRFFCRRTPLRGLSASPLGPPDPELFEQETKRTWYM